MRNVAGAPAAGQAAATGQDRELVIVLIPEGVQILGRIVVGIDVDQREIGVGINSVEVGLQMRKLLNATGSPGRPEIEQHYFAALFIQVPAGTIGVVAGEIGWCGSDGILRRRDRRQSQQ